jgi:hypothetical protein
MSLITLLLADTVDAPILSAINLVVLFNNSSANPALTFSLPWNICNIFC